MTSAPSLDVYLQDGESVVDGVRGYLAAVHEHLAVLHRDSRSGARVNETHSDLMDRLMRRLFELAEEDYFASGGEADTELSILAVGGYARREMSIHSDVDLLFLIGRLTPFVTGVAERVQRWMWDAQLQVGSATRTMADTISLARKDATVRTALLEHRFLVGSGVLFHRFARTFRDQLFSSPERFIVEQMEALNERHTRYGDTLYLLQPNLKESAGGLRDYHLSYWAMQATQPNARGRDDFLHLGLLTEEEVKEYSVALDFLWRVRNELHLTCGRKNDQLSFELQETIARSFGYGDEGESAPELPVERFMSDYYRQARAILNYSSLVIEQCHARVRKAPRRRRVRDVAHGFRVANDQLEIPYARQLREDPLSLLRVFQVAQQEDVPLTRKARRFVREHLHLVDEDFQRSPAALELFLGILSDRNRVMQTLMAMNEVGILGAYLPEWEHIVCRWQHVMYHTYTVDVHTIFLVEELRRLWKGEHAEQRSELTQLVREVDDLPVLFLGCLFHDIGKGLGGQHSEKGAALTRTSLERIGLSPERIERVVFLVAQHLTMSEIAQSRDLSDPKLILDFARLVGDRRNLRDLYLVTYADTRASSAKSWNAWKGQLLRELFERTSELLETGSDDPNVAMELVERRVEVRLRAAAGELRDQGFADERVAAYFDLMPRRYFTAHSPRQIARHAQVVLGLEKGQLMASAVREMRGDFSEYILYTRDRHGLHSNVSGVLTAHAINILGAHVYTSRDGMALEVYRVSTPPGGEAERRIRWDEFEASLAKVLGGELEVAALLARRGRPLGTPSTPRPRPATVTATNEESDFYTIVDVKANDRLGLLHDLTQVIADGTLEIYISKASTVLDQVKDTFYLKDDKGSKLLDASALEELRQKLLQAAQAVGQDGG